MRITGYGAGFGQPGDARDRAAAFRARHSIGQRIKGRILRREPNGLYWVQVGGEELLARLEVHADPGDQLIFVVRALTPEIVLQALSGGIDASDLPGLVQRFRAAREVFEVQDSALLAALCSLPPQTTLRRDAFAQALDARPEAAQRHARIQEFLIQINAAVEATQNMQALYLPWQLPALRRQEMLRRARSDGSQETALSAMAQDCGNVEARLLVVPNEARLSLSAEQPERCGALMVELFAWVRGECGLEPQMLSPARLKPSPMGGVLGELFGSVPLWSSGGLNTRV